MRYKPFGSTGLNVSAVTIGGWGVGGRGWGRYDDEESIRAIHRMIDNGANMIDTAPIYGRGHSEEVIGRAFAQIDRSRCFVATKVGTTWPKGPDAPVEQNLTRESIIRQMDDSLRRLDMDYVDLYTIHWPDTDNWAPPEETMDALEQLRREGKCRFIGVSNHSVAQLEALAKHGTIDAIQPPFSMIDQSQIGPMQWSREKGVATMTYASLGAGLLTGSIRTLPNYQGVDYRKDFYTYFREPMFSKCMKLLETLDAIAADRNKPVSQVTVNWSVQNPLVDTAIMGVRSISHADENCAAMEWSLSDDEIARINAAIAEIFG